MMDKTQDASDIAGAIVDRKPWTTPMVIVAETEDTAAKGFTTGDFTSSNIPYGS